MRKLIIAALLGFIAGQLVSPQSAAAQSIARLYATVSGVPIAVQADSSGYVKVVIH